MIISVSLSALDLDFFAWPRPDLDFRLKYRNYYKSIVLNSKPGSTLNHVINANEGLSLSTGYWYVSEYVLKDERGLIERHHKNFKVRLIKKGRKLCGQRLTE